MSQRTLDPRMLDSSQALPAMSGAALTGVDASDFVFISKTTISSTPAQVVNFDQTAYSNWVIWIRDLHTVSDGDIRIRWSNDNGSSSWTNQNYGYALNGGRDGSNADYGMSPEAYGLLADDSWNNAGAKTNATINFTTKAGDNQDEVCMWWSAGYTDSAYGSKGQSYTAGAIHVVAPGYNTAFEISGENGNIDEGTITLYGLKES